jgi:hypothetical protein
LTAEQRSLDELSNPPVPTGHSTQREAATMNQVWPAQVERELFFWELKGGDTIHPTTLSWMEERAEQYDCRH